MGINVLFFEIQAGMAVLIILLVRSGMRKLPRVYSYMLWLVVFVRLLIPVSFESPFGVMPSAVESRVWLEENIGWTGMTAVDENMGDTVASDLGMDEEAVGSHSVAAGNNGNAGVTGENFHTGTDSSANGNGESTDVVGEDSPMSIGHMTGTHETGNYDIGNMAGQGLDMDADHMTGGNAGTDFLMDGDNETGEPDILQSGIIGAHRNWQLSTIWETVLLILWEAGAAAILAYNGIALLLVKKQINKAECLKDNIYISRQVKSPFTLGIVRPKIYLPADLSEAEREYIICHERVHIFRKDYLVKNIAFLLTAFHWFNPFVWVAFNYMGRDMEMSCDEKVIGKMGEEIKKQYSQSLLNFAQGKCSVAMTPITFGENSVKQRVSNVLTYKSASRWAAVLGTVIIVVSAAMMFTVRGDAVQQESGSVADTNSDTRIPAENISIAVKNVGASPEIIQAGFMLARKTPYGALECWARAFTDRNGDMLYRLAADQEGFGQWEMAEQRGDSSFAFGESSPWPWEYDYEITVSAEGSTAEITFHMRTSAPEIYLLKEKVRITELEGLYYIDYESTWDNYSIETAQEYRDVYGEDAVYDESSIHEGGTVHDENNIHEGGNIHDETGIHGGNSVYGEMAALYDDAFYRAILAQLLSGNNPDFYHRFTDPVSAARELLHLGAGTGEVTELDMAPAVSLRSADTELTDWNGVKPSDWTTALSTAGEGSRVIVSYTFAKDGSHVDIPMELKEESQRIWGLAGGSIREIYKSVSEPEMIDHEEGKADLTYMIELSNYGIYRLGAHSGLTCLWAGDVGEEAAEWVYEDKLYIFESLEHAKENSSDEAEAAFVLDLLTGELHREHLAIPQNYEHIFPRVSFNIEGGFVHIYGFGSQTDSMPLENLNETIWNHKTFRQMSEADKQAYGVENRDYLLNNPDTLVRLSVREPGQTSAYIDLDGDGVSEQVILSADSDKPAQYWGYDAYRLQAGESMLAKLGNRLHNDIWAYSPDGEQIILALYEDGSSDDPRTCLFSYENGELNALGEFRYDIRRCTMENGVISGMERCDVIQTDAIYMSWQIGDSGKVERVPQKVYDFAYTGLHDIELLEELPVQNVLPPDEEGVYNGIFYFTISPQTVHFLQTDNTFSWVYVEAADGSRGWFQMDGYTVKELGKDSSEVFDGLIFCD